MPQFNGITVRVTNAEGHECEEWGVQQLRKQNKISAYIKSESEEAFRIIIQPKIPFSSSALSPAGEKWWKTENQDDALESNSRNQNTRFDKHDRRSNSRYSSSIYPKARRDTGNSYDTKDNLSSRIKKEHSGDFAPIKEEPSDDFAPIKEEPDDDFVPPFDLLASLYLDGRQRPERRVILYLDPKHPDFPRPNGKVRFKSRWVQGKDGAVEEHAWVFKDVGIETVFDRMLIAESHNQAEGVNELDEDAMIAAMNATELSAEGNIKNEEKSSIGQILIVVQRICVGVKWKEENYRPKHRNDQADDIEMNDLGNNITHTTKPTYNKTIPAGPISVVNYWPYMDGEGPYATFQFFYRSQETLKKFNFPDFPKPLHTPARNRLLLERKLIDMTPLSIAHPLQPVKSPTKNFEQQIMDSSFSPKEETKYKFNHHYREAVAVKEKIPPATHLKRRGSRSDATLLEQIKAPELNTRNSGKQKFQPSKMRERDIMELQKASEHGEGAILAPTAAPTLSTLETPTTATSNYHTPSTGARAGLEYSPSPFAAVGAASPSMVERESIFGSKIVPTESSVHLKNISNEFRISDDASDADDERDESGLETETEDEDLEKAIPPEEYDAANRDGDDGGLHMDFKEVAISKKRHISSDDGDDGYHSGERGGTVRNTPEDGIVAQTENQIAKEHSPPAGQTSAVPGEATTDELISMDMRFGSRSEPNVGKHLVLHQPPKRVKL